VNSDPVFEATRSAKACVAIVGAMLIVGCAGSTSEPAAQPKATPVASADPFPDWFYQCSLIAADGLCATSCVEVFDNNMSLAQKEATANARQDLSSQVQTRVEGLVKSVESKSSGSTGASTSSNFEAVAEQVTRNYLAGARPMRHARVKDEGRPNFCSLVAMSEQDSNRLFAELIRRSGRTLSSTDEEAIKQEFLMDRAKGSLQERLR